MKKLYQILLEDSSILIEKCTYSPGWFFRMKGLLGRKSLEGNEGIWLKPCNSIHMFFMRFPIDAVFLDRENKIVRISRNIQPWQISPLVLQAYSTLEIQASKGNNLKEGDALLFKEIQ